MATKRRIEITVETEQVTIARSPLNEAANQLRNPAQNLAQNLAAWCAGCQSHVLLIELRQAAHLAGLSYRQLVRKTDLNELHFHEPSDGSLLFCLASLSQWLRRAESTALLLPPAHTSSEEEK